MIYRVHYNSLSHSKKVKLHYSGNGETSTNMTTIEHKEMNSLKLPNAEPSFGINYFEHYASQVRTQLLSKEPFEQKKLNISAAIITSKKVTDFDGIFD